MDSNTKDDCTTMRILRDETKVVVVAAAATTADVPKTHDADEALSFDIDMIYKELGVFGTFQIRNYILIGLAMIFYASYLMSFVFTTSRLDYRSVRVCL